MRILGLAVALFAVLASAIVGCERPDTTLDLLARLASSPLIAAGAAAPVSPFLKIFIALFSVETIIFGLADFAARFGDWPEALEEAKIPTTLPLTVALFAIIVFAVSHIPVVRR